MKLKELETETNLLSRQIVELMIDFQTRTGTSITAIKFNQMFFDESSVPLPMDFSIVFASDKSGKKIKFFPTS